MFNVGSVQGYLKLNTSGWSSTMKGAENSLKSLSRTFTRTATVFLGSMGIIEREFGKFDKAIRHATSVTLTLTEEQFEEMSTMALDSSVRWNKAATDTAQAFYFLGSAGLTATEQMQAFNDTIMLSRAMGADLSTTVEGMVDIVRAFGLEFKDVTNIADQLTYTITSSNQMFADLDKALSYASSTARLTNNTLAETNAMLGIMANAGIKGCYDDQTEVLTKRGWLFWKDVTEDDEFATRNPDTKQIEHQKASRLIRYHHRGKMYHVTSRGVDLCVTPDHRMWVKSEVDRKFKIIKASEMTANHQYTYETLKYPDEFSDIIIRPNLAKWIDYDGEVFCAEVPNHLLIVRRNGKILVSGNSMAGTVLRRAMTNLMSPTAGMSALMHELGLRVYDTTGVMKPFIDIIGEISDQLVGTSDAYRNMVFEVLFGRRAIAGQITLFNYGSKALRRYANEIKNAGGTTQKVADKQMKAFTEVLGQLFREVQRLAIEVGELLAPTIERISNIIKNSVTGLRDYVRENKEALTVTLKWVSALSLLSLALPVILTVVSSVIGLVTPFTVMLATLYVFRTVWADTFKHGGVLNKALDEFGDVLETWMTEKFGAFGRMMIMTVEGWGIILGHSFAGWEMILKQSGKGWDMMLGLGGGTTGLDDVLESGKKAAGELKTMVVDRVIADIDLLTGKLMDMLPVGLASNINKLTALIKNLLSPDIMGKDSRFILNWEETDVLLRRINEDLVDLDLTGKKLTGGALTQWSIAISKYFKFGEVGVKQWSTAFQSAMANVESSWTDTMETIINEGGNMKDFLEDMFTGILRSFNRMIAEIAAADLMYAIAGGGAKRPTGMPSLVKYFFPSFGAGPERPDSASYISPGLSMPEYKGAGKRAVGDTKIEITNNTDKNLRETGRRFDGKQWVVSMVMEELSNNPVFAKAVSGG